jgi:hypothetical protein
MGEGNENLAHASPWDLRDPLHAEKNFTTCDLRLYFPYERKVCCRFFIALKNPSPWPGSNPKPFGPVASTLTITPPRRLLCSGHEWGRVLAPLLEVVGAS